MRAAYVGMVAGLLAGLSILGGCEKRTERLNAPPQGQTDLPSQTQDNYVRMADSALLKERSMSPSHFVPGSTELNGVGVRRLKRYATLLKVYGGELHYDGVEDSEELSNQRVDRIQQFLVSAGVGPDHFGVDVGPAGGQDLRAGETAESRRGLTATNSTVQASQMRIITNQR
ncbi:MAG: hypothetical protein HY718_18945 [Planctomycetes bacterium]|nr:hypothetical protein [Planctomycetota bacterium]